MFSTFTKPHRWHAQKSHAEKVWEHFDTVVAQQLVDAALQKKGVTLFDLYHALSRLRGKCESVKAMKVDEAQIPFAANTPFPEVDDERFGVHIPFSNMCEGNLINPKNVWGDEELKFNEKRLFKNEQKHVFRNCKLNIGLSVYNVDGDELRHRKPEKILEKLEPCFQQMLNAKDISTFLACASQIIYNMSNYSCLFHGSAAVNAWLIEKIFHARFGKHFTFPVSIRPYLQDWVGFYETQESYQAFYVMSAAINILLFTPGCIDRDARRELDAISIVLREDPFIEGNMEKRAQSWNKLKACITNIIDNDKLPEFEKQQLKVIMESKLIFRKPSPCVADLVNLFGGVAGMDVFTYIAGFMPVERRETLKNILEMDEIIADAHYASLGSHAVDGQLWFDLETIRHELIHYCIRYSTSYTSTRSALLKAVNATVSVTNQPSLDKTEFINTRTAGASFLTQEEAGQLPQHILREFTPTFYFTDYGVASRKAVISGGLRIQDMPKYSSEQLGILKSPLAVMLYNANLFIRAEDLVDETLNIMKDKIIRMVAKIYCSEELPAGDLSQHWKALSELPDDLFVFRKIKLSSLIGKTSDEMLMKDQQHLSSEIRMLSTQDAIQGIDEQEARVAVDVSDDVPESKPAVVNTYSICGF